MAIFWHLTFWMKTLHVMSDASWIRQGQHLSPMIIGFPKSHINQSFSAHVQCSAGGSFAASGNCAPRISVSGRKDLEWSGAKGLKCRQTPLALKWPNRCPLVTILVWNKLLLKWKYELLYRLTYTDSQLIISCQQKLVSGQNCHPVVHSSVEEEYGLWTCATTLTNTWLPQYGLEVLLEDPVTKSKMHLKATNEKKQTTVQ